MKLLMWRLLDNMTRSTAELASNGEVLTVELHVVNSSESPQQDAPSFIRTELFVYTLMGESAATTRLTRSGEAER